MPSNHEIELAGGAARRGEALAAERAGLDRIPDPTIALRYGNNFDGNDRVVGVNVTVPIGGARRRAEYSIAPKSGERIGTACAGGASGSGSDAAARQLAVRSTHSQWMHCVMWRPQQRNERDRRRRGYSLSEFHHGTDRGSSPIAVEAAQAAATAQLEALEAASRLRLDSHEIWSLEQ